SGVALFAAFLGLAGCGGGTTPAPQQQQPQTTQIQPNYPASPPVAITWSPQSSPLPAPEAQQPPPAGSNNFPLSISSPMDGATVTSPVTVTASATPKNPIFFMRVYVDDLAVYFTFSNSIDAAIWIPSGPHKVEVMAEDNQGYISATILNI